MDVAGKVADEIRTVDPRGETENFFSGFRFRKGDRHNI